MRKTLKKIKNPSKLKETRRKLAIRKKVIGTADRPRICAVKSNKNISVQVIDDTKGITLFSVQTFGKNKSATKGNAEGAKALGKALSEKLKAKKLDKAVFDRNGKQYTGVVAALASSIRENGIQI
jgi:large subunit ribosomal protein L18